MNKVQRFIAKHTGIQKEIDFWRDACLKRKASMDKLLAELANVEADYAALQNVANNLVEVNGDLIKAAKARNDALEAFGGKGAS